MQELGYGAGTPKVGRALGMVAGTLLLVAVHSAHAQTNPAGSAADQAPSEAARRAALSPYRFILQNATAPARKATAPSKPAAETAAATDLRRPASAPGQEPAVKSASVKRAASPAAPEVTDASAPSAPAQPAVATLSRQPVEPAPPAPRRDVIPIRTDEPRLSAALLREQPHGTVRVLFEIQPDGSVSDVKVVSSTNRSLNRPTVDAVKGWKFQPVDELLSVETELVYKFDN